MERHIDTIRLDRLSDPKFAFGYDVAADGQVKVSKPVLVVARNLRQAIDYTRGSVGEMPMCVRCRFPLNETHRVPGEDMRWNCPECQTVFSWQPPGREQPASRKP